LLRINPISGEKYDNFLLAIGKSDRMSHEMPSISGIKRKLPVAAADRVSLRNAIVLWNPNKSGRDFSLARISTRHITTPGEYREQN
jgi:hypothetical protein